MNKLTFGLIGFICGVFLLTPVLAFSAPSLSARLKGRLLLAVEDKGRVYYVAQDGYRYLVTRATAQKIFEKLAMGITNKNLAQIPIKEVATEPEQQEDTGQVAGESATVVEKIVYKDKSAQCDYSSYTNRIESYKNEIKDLNKQIDSLKEQLGQQTEVQPEQTIFNSPFLIDNTDAKKAVSKDYNLRINTLENELLQISDFRTKYKKSNGRVYSYIGQGVYNPSGSNYDEKMVAIGFNDFQNSLLMQMISKLKATKPNDMRNGIEVFLLDKESEIRSKISILQNEREKKLLELE